MAGLDKLPTEVLLEIVSNLGRMRDLAALSTQCQRLHQIVDMPKFRQFHRIRLHRGLTRDEADDISDLALQILRIPALGSYVRQLEVYDPPSIFRSPQLPKEVDIEENEDIKLFRLAVLTAGLDDYEEKLVKSFLEDTKGSLGVLLMAICPNIDTLQICEPGSLLADCLKRNNSKDTRPRFLRRLQTVKLLDAHGDDHRFYNIIDLRAMIKLFHRLPSVQTISASAMTLEHYNYMRKLTPRKSNFSRVHLDYSCIAGCEISSIIQNCKSLDEFKYSIGGRTLAPSSPRGVAPKTLGLALRQHKSTLRVLDLDIDEAIDSDDESTLPSDDDSEGSEPDCKVKDEDNAGGAIQGVTSGNFGRSIGSLLEFTALKRLSIGINLLLGISFDYDTYDYAPPPFRLIDTLPPNLEYLCIRGYYIGADEIHTDQVSEFMQHRARRLPQLREVAGVERFIPSAEHVCDPDGNPELLFPEDAENWWDYGENSGEKSDE